MTLQASGAISLGQIAAEFIDTAPHSMSEFRGRNGLPTGTIRFSNCYGEQGKYSTYITYGTSTTSGGKFNITTTTSGFYSGTVGSSSIPSFTHKKSGISQTITLRAMAAGTYIGRVVDFDGFTSITPTRDSVFSYFTKNGVTYNSSAATFSSLGSGRYRWTFPTTATFWNSSGTATFKLV